MRDLGYPGRKRAGAENNMHICAYAGRGVDRDNLARLIETHTISALEKARPLSPGHKYVVYVDAMESARNPGDASIRITLADTNPMAECIEAIQNAMLTIQKQGYKHTLFLVNGDTEIMRVIAAA